MERKSIIHEVHEKARPFLESVTRRANEVIAATRHRLPNASEPQVFKEAGDVFVAKTEQEVSEASSSDGTISPDRRKKIIRYGVGPALRVALDQEKEGVPSQENAVTLLENAGEQELITDSVEAMANDDPVTATRQAELIDRINKSRVHEIPHPSESATELARRVEWYENLDAPRLRESFNDVLAGLSPEEKELIVSNIELSHLFAHAINELGADNELGVEEDESAGDYLGKPEKMEQANEMVECAERVNVDFQDTVRQLAHALGGLYQEGSIKKVDRIVQKADKEYKGVVSRVKDVVRSRIIIPGNPTVDDLKIIDALKPAGLVIATDTTDDKRIKRSFIDETSDTPLSIHERKRYLDTKVTLALADPSTRKQLLAEVTIATPEMAAATNIEHPIYEIWRTLLPKEGDIVPPELETLLLKLRELRKNFYKSVSYQQSTRLLVNGDSEF